MIPWACFICTNDFMSFVACINDFRCWTARNNNNIIIYESRAENISSWSQTHICLTVTTLYILDTCIWKKNETRLVFKRRCECTHSSSESVFLHLDVQLFQSWLQTNATQLLLLRCHSSNISEYFPVLHEREKPLLHFCTHLILLISCTLSHSGVYVGIKRTNSHNGASACNSSQNARSARAQWALVLARSQGTHRF